VPTQTVKGQIFESIGARLSGLTTANGYTTDVKKVYLDEIPMGMELNNYQLPAIFLIDAPEQNEFQQSCYIGNWEIRMQLWHNRVGDIAMMQYVREVFKVLYANSATAQVWDKFRALHPKIVEFKPLSITPDLNMIESNRVVELSFLVSYRTKLYDL